MSDILFTITEASDYLKVHWQTIRSYIKKGDLNSVKIGKNIRIKESDLEDFVESKKRASDPLEFEIRFIVNDRKEVERRLLNLNAKLIYHGHVIDHWSVPSSIKNLDQKNVHFDNAKHSAIRIREQDNGYTGKIITSLEAKKLLEPHKHEVCIESEVQVENYKETKKLLVLMNLKEFCKLEKDRMIYSLDGAKVVFDDIKNFKLAIEIEIKSIERKTL